MRFERLPKELLAHIGSFLDPRARIMYLLALQNFYQDDTALSSIQTYHCWYCVMDSFYSGLVMEQVYKQDSRDPGDEFICWTKLVKYKKTSEKIIQRGPQRFLVKSHKRRDYNLEDPELNLIFNHIGLG